MIVFFSLDIQRFKKRNYVDEEYGIGVRRNYSEVLVTDHRYVATSKASTSTVLLLNGQGLKGTWEGFGSWGEIICYLVLSPD